MVSSLQVGQRLVGRTGTSYLLHKVLYERKQKEAMYKLWLALSNDNFYVVKPVTPFAYDQAFRLQKDLSFSPYVRVPVDGNDANTALIFPHYTEDFLSFMQSGPVSRLQVKRILLDVMKGIAACHSKDWVHCDVKPNNIMISYTSRSDSTREIDGVFLSDTEAAAKVKEGEAIFLQVGNVLWRSPEAQTGISVGKASDVWSFGVTVYTPLFSYGLESFYSRDKLKYSLTQAPELPQAAYGITKLAIFAYDKLEDGVEPEIEVLANMLSYFGPLPEGLIKHTQGSVWCDVLKVLYQSFDVNTPRKPFYLWRDIKGLEPGDKEFLVRILNLDPGLRPLAGDLLNDQWFHSP
ncbi:hypothetical protein MMC17_005540 [Xylographa soralifera]|nr:hypothetical protein [Xylographa soralifera]